MLEQLREWRRSATRKPLILLGARQTGKTWLLQEFGRTDFAQTLYINFENDAAAAALFNGDFDVQRLIPLLGALKGVRTEPERTLLIFDEVQAAPRVLTSLKYFAEQAPAYAVCAAGSLLGVALHEGISFPVGKVEFRFLQPLTFREFLEAEGQELLLGGLDALPALNIPEPFAQKLADYLRSYMLVGGMPEAVQTWVNTHAIDRVRRIQQELIRAYERDFSKHVPAKEMDNLLYVWHSIPVQLARENKRFIYGAVREGGRGRDFERALQWLENAGMLRRVNAVSKGIEPLRSYEQDRFFKIYHLDIGLLGCMMEVRPALMAEGERIFSEFFGALAEQLVLQELQGYLPDKRFFYWHSGNSAEVEFVYTGEDGVVPIEVKDGANLRAKSLTEFRRAYCPPCSVIASHRPVQIDHEVLKLPLYHLHRLSDAIREARAQQAAL